MPIEPFVTFCVPLRGYFLFGWHWPGLAFALRKLIRISLRAIERHTDPRLEQAAEVLTWGADEKLLLAAAMIGWLLTRKSEDHTGTQARMSSHARFGRPAAYP